MSFFAKLKRMNEFLGGRGRLILSIDRGPGIAEVGQCMLQRE
jgi:hypothetical protein